jgi:hypothetical protein
LVCEAKIKIEGLVRIFFSVIKCEKIRKNGDLLRRKVPEILIIRKGIVEVEEYITAVESVTSALLISFSLTLLESQVRCTAIDVLTRHTIRISGIYVAVSVTQYNIIKNVHPKISFSLQLNTAI